MDKDVYRSTVCRGKILGNSQLSINNKMFDRTWCLYAVGYRVAMTKKNELDLSTYSHRERLIC